MTAEPTEERAPLLDVPVQPVAHRLLAEVARTGMMRESSPAFTAAAEAVLFRRGWVEWAGSLVLTEAGESALRGPVEPDHWVSCSREVDPEAAKHRHIVRKGHRTTVCGLSGSTGALWRGNKTKPRCERCEADYVPAERPTTR